MTQLGEIEDLKREADRQMTLILRKLIEDIEKQSGGKLAFAGINHFYSIASLHVNTKFEVK